MRKYVKFVTVMALLSVSISALSYLGLPYSRLDWQAQAQPYETETPTRTPTGTATATKTATRTPTNTSTATATGTMTTIATATSTTTFTPTTVATETATATPSATATPTGRIVAVKIRDFAYNPQVIIVATGTTVEWTNYDNIEHTVTSSDSGPLESGTLTSGQSYRYTFATAGIYPYFCKFHPGMTGTVIVVNKLVEVYLPVVLENHTGTQ